MTTSDGVSHLWPTAEQRLLLDAALRHGDDALTAFATWRARVDLMEEFRRDVVRLLPAVYHNMQRHGSDDPILPRLKGVYRRAWYDTTRLFHRVAPVIGALRAADIDIVLLKGAPLALAYYDTVAERPMGDVDVMVRAGDLDRAIDTLRRSGWDVRPLFWDTRRFRHATQCIGPDRAELDLHWHVIYEAASDAADDALLATTEPLSFLGHTVRQLDPTSLFFLVIVHGVRWSDVTPVRWIPDAMAILERRAAAIDWDRLIGLATAHRLNHRMALGIEYLLRHDAAPIPASVPVRLRAQRISWIERAEHTAVITEDARVGRTLLANQWMWIVEYLRCADGWNPLRLIYGYSHYLRYRLGLTARRQLFPFAARRIWRRLTVRNRPVRPHPAAQP